MRVFHTPSVCGLTCLLSPYSPHGHKFFRMSSPTRWLSPDLELHLEKGSGFTGPRPLMLTAGQSSGRPLTAGCTGQSSSAENRSSRKRWTTGSWEGQRQGCRGGLSTGDLGAISRCACQAPNTRPPCEAHSTFSFPGERESLGVTEACVVPCNVGADDRTASPPGSHRLGEGRLLKGGDAQARHSRFPGILLAGSYFHRGADRRKLSRASWDQQPLICQQQIRFYFKR